MIRLSMAAALGVWLTGLAPAPVADAAAVITGTVRSKAGRPLAGLVLLEKGEIHNNVWHKGALVDSGGRFRIELADGGQYGVHVYASGYIYAPQAVRVDSGKTLELTVALVPEPTRAILSFPHEPRAPQLVR